MLKWIQYKLKIKFVLLKRVVEGIKNGVYCSFSLAETGLFDIQTRYQVTSFDWYSIFIYWKISIHYSTKLHEILKTVGFKKNIQISRICKQRLFVFGQSRTQGILPPQWTIDKNSFGIGRSNNRFRLRLFGYNFWGHCLFVFVHFVEIFNVLPTFSCKQFIIKAPS